MDGGQGLSRGKLVKERRALNVTETEESFVVQYLVLGGHKTYVTRGRERADPWLAASGVHAGSGRLVFGWSEQQRCDLVLFFSQGSGEEGCCARSRIYYHNHHGNPWHYSGHEKGCPQKIAGALGGVREKEQSRLQDCFRRGLAEALTQVCPQRVSFSYTVTSSCQLSHGMRVPDVWTPSRQLDPLLFGSAKECLLRTSCPEARENCFLPSSKTSWDPRALAEAIRRGEATGFVTVTGGRESDAAKLQDPAGHRFGFCVQRFAPGWGQVGDFTKRQIAGYFGWTGEADGGEAKTREFIAKQATRTLCSNTFMGPETVSTTYLGWLMEARGFADFTITHFLQYKFCNWGGDFLEPVLQERHDRKRSGDAVAAECLKLIGNGSYGYNGLESCNYDQLKLMTDKSLAARYKSGELGLCKIKHLTLLGVVKTSLPPSKSAAKKKAKRERQADAWFDSEAGESVDRESGRRKKKERSEGAWSHPCFEPGSGSEAEQASVSDEESRRYCWKDHKSRLARAKTLNPTLRGARESSSSSSTSASEADDLDLEEALVGRAEHKSQKRRRKKKAERKHVYRFLYAVSVGGEQQTIVNSLARAVAVLSNSKRLFLGHLDTMFKCLDPGKAELCYVDTDSCIWSLSEPQLSDCLRPDKKTCWERAAILADEDGEKSCHGLMKLEGVYRGGVFKNIKIYRLFDETGAESDANTYTRCKGVSRATASLLDDGYFFQSQDPPTVVVHRSSLRPSRAGEIFLTREAKSLAVPFNLKRRVDETGIHSVCFEPTEPAT